MGGVSGYRVYVVLPNEESQGAGWCTYLPNKVRTSYNCSYPTSIPSYTVGAHHCTCPPAPRWFEFKVTDEKRLEFGLREDLGFTGFRNLDRAALSRS